MISSSLLSVDVFGLGCGGTSRRPISICFSAGICCQSYCAKAKRLPADQQEILHTVLSQIRLVLHPQVHITALSMSASWNCWSGAATTGHSQPEDGPLGLA